MDIKNIFFKSRRIIIFLLLFINSSLFANFQEIYNLTNPIFSYSIDNNKDYRVYIKDSKYILYDRYINKGFKLLKEK